jgi:PAS domain S-box-containing protein
MKAETERTADEVKHLKACINDLISVVALPAVWSGGEPSQIVSTLFDVLLSMLGLEFVYARLKDPFSGAPIDMVRVAQARNLAAQPQDVGRALNPWLGDDPHASPLVVRNPIGDGNGDVSIAPCRLGLHAEIGVLVAGSRRADFPTKTERLLLDIAANQAAIGLQDARLLNEQRRVAEELDQRVAQRTRELAAVNEELREEIAERKRAEEKLRRSEAYLAEAERLAHVGSSAFDVATRTIVHFSQEHFRLFGLDPEAGMPSFEVARQRIHPEDRDRILETFNRAVNERKDFEADHRTVLPDGTIKYVHVIAHPAFNASGDLVEYVGTVMDLTERKEADEKLREAQAELAHVSRVTTLGEMAASIAHEVNQPLSGVVINANACLRFLTGATQNLDEVRDGLQAIARDGRRASDVIGRIRALARRTMTEKELLSINDVIREVVGLAEGEARRTRARLRTDLAGDLPRVLGDRVQLQQVVLNLLLNGLDAMQGVVGRPRELVISTQREASDRVRVAVQDSGSGIDPQLALRIFDPFYTTKSSGLGMGLSISRSIIEQHDGRLWAVPNDGPGTTFHFTV